LRLPGDKTIMNAETEHCRYFLVDIDATLTDYRPGSLEKEKLLHGNFLFPIFRDLMLESGWEREKAEKAIGDYAEDVIFWDYPDFIAEFRLPAAEAFRRMREWHRKNLVPVAEGVNIVKELHALGKELFIMSNNPYVGCLFKLEAAGLAENEYASPYFRRVFGTNILRGCKNSPDVWRRALALIPADVSEICTVGDNPKEDGEIPYSVGITHNLIIGR